MSTGAENQAKLNAGYRRIAAQLGVEYAVYGFQNFNPMAEENFQFFINAAFTADPNFSAPLKHNKAVWICYTDADQIDRTHILVGPYGTFYIGDRQPFQPMQAVRCNRVVNLGRVEYSTGGQLTATVINYAEQLPIFMQFAREDIQKAAGAQNAQQLGRAITHWTVFIPGHDGMIKQDDVMFDQDGIKYVIDAPDFTNMGYVCHVRLATI